MNVIGSPFLAMQLLSSHAGVKISAIEFGCEVTTADQPGFGVMALVVENISGLSIAQAIQPQLGIGGMLSPLLAFEKRFRYARNLRNAPFDRSDIYIDPIEIAPGTPFAAIVAFWKRDGPAMAFDVYPWLTVRGQMISHITPVQGVAL